jgi:hypothetical protein
MNSSVVTRAALGLLIMVTFTGCFRVSSETRALRDAALDGGLERTDEKIELGLGMFTFGAARMVCKFVDLPVEARAILGSVKGAECSVFEFKNRTGNLATILSTADNAMEKRGRERVVGVLKDDNLVAVYVPEKAGSGSNISFSVLVIADGKLICASARGDVRDVLNLAMAKAGEHIPARTQIAAK